MRLRKRKREEEEKDIRDCRDQKDIKEEETADALFLFNPLVLYVPAVLLVLFFLF